MMDYKKFAVLLTASAVLPVQAAEWVFDGSANPRYGYDDNVFLQEDEESSFDFKIKPTVNLSRFQANSSSTLSLGYAIERYFSVSELDTDNPFARFDTQYQFERMQLGLKASYIEDSTRNDALEDTGDFSTNATLTSRSLSPSISYQLTEVDTVTATVDYSDKRYSTADFADSETKGLTLGWQRQFTERFSGGLSVSSTNYQIEDIDYTSDDDNYNLSWQMTYQWSELWLIDGSVGYRRLDSERTDLLGNTTSDQSSGISYNIDITHEGELNTISLALSKQLSPSSDGDVSEQERIGVVWTRLLSEQWSFNLSTSYQESTSTSNDDDTNRENLDFSPSFSWQFSPTMNLNLGYSYRKQKQDGAINQNVDSNSVSLSLNYNWDGIRVSR